MLRAAVLWVALTAPAFALTPPAPPAVIESDMMVMNYYAHGFNAASGLAVAQYQDPYELQSDGVYRPRSKAAPALHGFIGARVVHCASGRIVAVKDERPVTLIAALSATEFLRPLVQADKPIPFQALRQAAEAVYGRQGIVVLRDTAETVDCAWSHPDLRPADRTPAAARDDLG